MISRNVLVVLMLFVAAGSCQLQLSRKQVCPPVQYYSARANCLSVRDWCSSHGDCRRDEKCCPTERRCYLSCQRTVQQKRCSEPIDLAIILDSSGSISRRNWERVKNFAKILVDQYDVSESGTHIAIVTYSSRPRVDIKFNSYKGVHLNAINIKRDIDSLRHMRGFTFIDKALYKANHEIFTAQAGMRKGIRKVCIVFTDGQQTTKFGRYTPLNVASRPLKAKGVGMFSLGVGRKYNSRNLREMASTPIQSHVFTASNFEQLSKKAGEIAKTQCRIPCNKPVDLAVLLDSSGSISKKNWNQVKNFAKVLVDIFDVSEKGSHIAIITYSTRPKVDLTFNTFRGRQLNKVNIKGAIDKLQHQKGLTYINRALIEANRKIFNVQTGMRRNVAKLCIVLTDGIQTHIENKKRTLSWASRQLLNKGVSIYSLGVGSDIEVMDLIDIAHKPDNVFSARHFSHLSAKAKEISKSYCKVNSMG